MLRPPVLPPHLLARVRPPGQGPLPTLRHPDSADWPHGVGLLHSGVGVGEVLRRVLSIPAQKVGK